jgi:hypothetical protein
MNPAHPNDTINIIYTPVSRAPTPALEIINLEFMKIDSNSCQMDEIDIRKQARLNAVIAIDEGGEENQESAKLSVDYTRCIPAMSSPPICKIITNHQIDVSISPKKMKTIKQGKVKKHTNNKKNLPFSLKQHNFDVQYLKNNNFTIRL